jgi:alkylation response protein AidB-like acyl-CoA dehydrogenase
VTWELTAGQQRLRERALALGRAWGPRRVELRRHTYAKGAHQPEFWARLCEAGFLGLLVPPELGGTGAGVLGAVLVQEGLAEGGAPVPFPVLTHSVARVVDRFGTTTLRQRILPDVAAGRSLMALAFTEAEAGHNYLAMRTSVRRGGMGYRLDGRKTYISGVDLADRLFVVGRAEREDGPGGEVHPEGWPAFTGLLVDRRAPGVHLDEIDMAGREGVRQWQVTFAGVEVDAADLVGAHGAAGFYLFEMFNLERLLYSALMLGLAAYWLTEATAFATSRTVFADRSIFHEQAIQHPQARHHARLHGARLATIRAAARMDTDPDAAAAEVSMAKLLAAEVVHDVTDQALQTYGGRGFDRRLGLVDDLLDTRLFRSAPVSQELTLNHIANHALRPIAAARRAPGRTD